MFLSNEAVEEIDVDYIGQTKAGRLASLMAVDALGFRHENVPIRTTFRYDGHTITAEVYDTKPIGDGRRSKFVDSRGMVATKDVECVVTDENRWALIFLRAVGRVRRMPPAGFTLQIGGTDLTHMVRSVRFDGV